MAVLIECVCHKKQSLKNKMCSECGQGLDALKRTGKAKYWIAYRVNGILRREVIGCSLSEAKDAEGKRRVQKREKRIFEILPESNMTFSELTEWYLGLATVKNLASYPTIEICLNKFNSELGNKIVSEVKPIDLENYQLKRKKEGKADHTIDSEIGAAKTMLNKAFDNDRIGGEALRWFKKVKKLLKRNANARSRILSMEEFNRVVQVLPLHARWIVQTGFHTGMRRAEITSLTWDKVSTQDRVIRLEAKDTKDKEPREIPINDDLCNILNSIPKHIHDKHVFLYRGKPVRNISRTIRTACKKAGIPYGRFRKEGFVFHDLRRTFNTRMRKSGVAESVIMSITGHSTREMFDRYNTVDIEDKREGMRKFQESIRKDVHQSVHHDQEQTL